MDDDWNTLDELESLRRSVNKVVYLLTAIWGDWKCIKINLDDATGAMKTRRNSMIYGFNDEESGETIILHFSVKAERLDECVEEGWRAVVRELEPLREKTAALEVDLKGWREDAIMKSLEKKFSRSKHHCIPMLEV